MIEKDVDGPRALPQRIDGQVANLGKHSACRRVARTVYLGSAPSAGAPRRGLEDRRIKLGCVLRGGQVVSPADPDAPGVLVRPEAARRQLDAERAAPVAPPAPGGAAETGESGTGPAPGAEPSSAPPDPRPTRFHGSVALDATRAGRDAGRVADEVIAHLAGLVGSNVRVTLEIEADVPGGAPEHVVRTVTENSRTLKFDSHGFERE